VNGNLNTSGGIAVGLGDTGHNTLNVAGTLTNNAGGNIEMAGQSDLLTAATLVNNANANIFMENGETLRVSGDLTNSGCIALGSNGCDGPTTGGNALEVGGTLTNNASGEIVLELNDAITTAGLINSGFIFLSPQAQVTTGFLSFNPGSTLGIAISGPTTFGAIQVNGDVNLSGTLNAYLQNGFLPPAGEAFKFLTFTPGGLSGTFSSIQGYGGENFYAIYNDSAGYVDLVAEGASGSVPEPSSLVLFGSGLLGMVGFLRRRSRH
jgi:hypothetical protein